MAQERARRTRFGARWGVRVDVVDTTELVVALDEALLGLRPRPQVTTAARVVAAG